MKAKTTLFEKYLIIILLFILILPMNTIAYTWGTNNWWLKIDPNEAGSTVVIDGVTYTIQNTDTIGTSLFVPTKTSPEYNSFLSSSIGATIAAVGGGGLINPVSCMSIKKGNAAATDGVYTIDPDGDAGNSPFSVYCDMTYDGGGWTMMMKATRGTTFNYDASYWTTNNTLNESDTTTNDGDAKFRSFNEYPVKDLIARWPDIAADRFWIQNNFNDGTAALLPTFFSNANLKFFGDAKTYSGFTAGSFSSQADIRFYGFNFINNKNYGLDADVRWGFGWNENGEGLYTSPATLNTGAAPGSDDVSGGIGMSSSYGSYSAGDYIACCQDSTGMNRSARVEIYGRNQDDPSWTSGGGSGTCLATGGTITQSNGYCIHTFTSDGTFTSSVSTNAEVLVVAGGGGGGTSVSSSGGGGGGGAGGLVYDTSHNITAQAYTVTVGGGGAAGATASGQYGSNGSNSSFDTITAIGGGGGSRDGGSGGNAGGSGGGGGYNGYSYTRYGGAGTAGQGNAGGNTDSLSWAGGAGGGGAGGAGGNNKINHQGGDGGAGLAISITGSLVTYAMGGGGGDPVTPVSNAANTGNGGDGAYSVGAAKSGASGIVIIRYPIGTSVQTEFVYTGADQTYTVPAGVTSITTKMWGAGGGAVAPGGGGGFTTATMSVTPGEVLTLIVGGGGLYGSNTGSYGGGGGSWGWQLYYSGGGGRSEINKTDGSFIIAGGGGGGADTASASFYGGAGGGEVGQNAGQSTGGYGGGSGVGGAGGTAYTTCVGCFGNSGDSRNGGQRGNNGDQGCGAGGGGGYGGGGAGAVDCGAAGGGGGGGSGCNGSSIVNCATSAGLGSTPGNANDPDRGAAGQGGLSNSNGDNGKIIITAGSNNLDCKATGGTITEAGGYKIHTFTSNGTFTPSVNCNAEVLVVAGGGGAGQGFGGGGGGGGLIYNSSYPISAATAVTVGNGGAVNTNGDNSIFGSLAAVGGGAGGGSTSWDASEAGHSGGSGGGGGSQYFTAYAGGAGTSGQGNSGGSSRTYSSQSYASAGGGGAGAVGGNPSETASGNGGIGLSYDISGTHTFYAGGGGGYYYHEGPVYGTLGTPGEGTIGGGGTADVGKAGIVIVRYPSSSGKRVFVTSGSWQGNMGNAVGGDALCVNAASTAGLSGTWLSSLSGCVHGGACSAFADRSTHSNEPYKLLDGTIIASNWDDLADGVITNPINRDEYNNPVGSVEVWTGTNGALQPAGWWGWGYDWCGDGGWVMNSSWGGAYGLSSATDINWTNVLWRGYNDGGTYNWGGCATYKHLYCFEQ